MKGNSSLNGQNTEPEGLMFSNWHFSNTIKDIIRTMTGLELIEEKFHEDNLKEFNGSLSSVILLTGNKNIMITLTMSKEAACTLVGFITGMKYSEIKEEDLYDGIAEIANMLGGQFKAKLAVNGQNYKYLTPFTIAGEDHHIVQKSKVYGISKIYHAGSIKIKVGICFL